MGSAVSSVFGGFGKAIGSVLGVNPDRSAKKAAKAAQRQAEALEALAAEPETPIPIADDQAAAEARRRSIAQQIRRRGRQSTILTGPPGPTPLGGA